MHFGFGLAGVFMFFGMLQFYFGQKIFGVIGNKPLNKEEQAKKDAEKQDEEELPANVGKDRLFVVAVLMITSIFFFLAFEQAGVSLCIFAKDFTQRVLEGIAATSFKWIDAILTIFPIVVVTIVLVTLAKKIFKQYPLTILFTLISFASITVLGLWKVQREFTSLETEVTVSWFQILNAFFIVMFASAFSKLWEKYWNPSGLVKFALGLFLVGFSFVVVAYGAS